MQDVNILEKQIRAQVIREYMEAIGQTKAVIFTCGNAAKYLRELGVPILAIGENEELKPQKSFTHEEIAKQFPSHFNASSGDIPLFLISEIGNRLRTQLGDTFTGGKINVGSSETLLALTIAYPELKEKIEPFRNGQPENQYNEHATLNPFMRALYTEKIWE